MRTRIALFAILLATSYGVFASSEEAGSLKKQYAVSCAGCHESGAAGAPKSGDVEAWKPRIDKGLPGLLASAKEGMGLMPRMGSCYKCSDEELEALIKFMLTKKREAL